MMCEMMRSALDACMQQVVGMVKAVEDKSLMLTHMFM